MSGSTIGGVVGGVIGWFVGGPAGAQWGFMIGSAVGAIVAPEQFEGPRLGEAKTQTANDGVPLIYGYGTFPCAGNLAWVDEVKEHRKKESAKGGPETITYTYTVSYMIVVCQGEISGYKLIKRNGKIVYDARTDAELSELGYSSNEIAETRANQAAFLQRATLYYGTQTQMPDPTMVAVEGAGNVPAYTGIAYIVLKDDETREGEVSQYEFVVATCGDRQEEYADEALILVTGGSFDTGPSAAKAYASSSPEFVGIPAESGADLDSGICNFGDGVFCIATPTEYRYSLDMLESFSGGEIDLEDSGVSALFGGRMGWVVKASPPFSSMPVASQPPVSFSNISPVAMSTDGINSGNAADGSRGFRAGNYYYNTGGRGLIRSDDPKGTWEYVWDVYSTVAAGWNPNGQSIQYFYDGVGFGGKLHCTVRWGFNEESAKYQIRSCPEWGEAWQDGEVLFETDSPVGAPFQLAVTDTGVIVAYCTGTNTGIVEAGIRTSVDDFATLHLLGVSGVNTGGGINELTLPRKIAAWGQYAYVVGNLDGQGKCVTFDTETLAIVSSVVLPIGSAQSICIGAAVSEFLVRIPDAPGFYVNRMTGEIIGPSGAQIDVCQPSLGEIVADQCDRRGVFSRDVSELTDDVGGYRIAAPSTPQRNIQGLQPGYFFSASEFDGTLHFPKRGRAMTFALTHDDFVERDGDPIQWERTQEPELLRKVTVGYVDPETTYIATTQAAERRSATISAEGESTTELAVTGSRDWAAQVADKSMKVAWGEPDECTFHVSIEHAELVTGAEGTVPYTDGTATAIRIDRIEDEGLVRIVTGRRTRANLYESNASGVAKPLPRFPGSNIRGPTDSVLMNLPIMNDANDSLGLTWAAAGMTSGWVGSQLQVLRAGQWQVAAEITSPCGMGTLLSPLPSHAGDFDGTNVLHIRFSDDLESVTYEALLTERNPLAVVYPDGTSEIVQFQVATEIAPGEYELTNLIRGNLDTTKGAHDAGARVVFLDSAVQWVPLQVGDIGQTLQFRAVSLGTDPDAASIFAFEMTVAESQREWAVAEFNVVQDGDDFHLSWIPRHRLGTDVSPVRSANWDGYVVGWQYGGQMHQESTQADSITFTLPGASNIDFRVVQNNRITGEGTQTTVNIQ